MSADSLYCQDSATILTASGGATGIVLEATIQNGPIPGKVWVLDAASAIIYDPTGANLEGYSAGNCGIFIVPITAPSAGADTATNINISARGLQIDAFQGAVVIGGNGPTTTIVGLTAKGPIVVPSGFTIKTIWSNGVGGAPDAGTTIFLYAAIRTLKSS